MVIVVVITFWLLCSVYLLKIRDLLISSCLSMKFPNMMGVIYEDSIVQYIDYVVHCFNIDTNEIFTLLGDPFAPTLARSLTINVEPQYN